jgi:hypothetical protein
MMRIILLVLACLATTAHAADPRWTFAVGQGVSAARIVNQAGSTVEFNCNSGGLPPVGPGLAFTVGGKIPRGTRTTLFIVDGTSHSIQLLDGQIRRAQVGFEVEAIMRIAHALVQAKASSFVVEVPHLDVRERFPLRDVRASLGERAGRTLADCAVNK